MFLFKLLNKEVGKRFQVLTTEDQSRENKNYDASLRLPNCFSYSVMKPGIKPVFTIISVMKPGIKLVFTIVSDVQIGIKLGNKTVEC